MLDELWTEARVIVQESVIRTILKKKKYTKAKWLSNEGLQIPEKRRKAKGKGEKQSYIQLNADSKESQGGIKEPSSVISSKN